MRNAAVRILRVALVALALPGCCFGGAGADEEIDEEALGNVVPVSSEDPEILAAQARARAGLDGFVASLQRATPAEARHAIKAPFRQGDVVEHMWVGALRWDGASFVGQLDNDPVDVTHVRRGETVTVARDDVEDRIYFEGETMRGGYTIEVLMRRSQGAP